MAELKYVKDDLVELTGEMRKPVEFRPCPDCGCSKYPFFNGSTIHISRGNKLRQVYAYCGRCGWETDIYKTVAECAEEWNEAEV